MVLSREVEELTIGEINNSDLLCKSSQVLGNGAINNIYDAIVVDIDSFDRSKSKEVALEVGKLNAKLMNEKRPYLLFGVGRWGSLDPWLGIPITWDQISGASVIVESGFKDFSVTPSQGSHFFQNLTSFRVGYFTVNSALNEFDTIDWNWLKTQPAKIEFKYTRLLKFDKPVSVRINGHENKGVILKPGVEITEI
jgi:hypothetical protein